VKGFASSLYDHARFRESFDPFAARVARAGEQISLAQTLLKLTSPGLPDIYQGDELWNFSLVDPDNRRPVDWDERRRALDGLQRGATPTRATAKLHLIWKTLQARSSFGEYEPVDAGPDVCAFTRGDVLVAVPLRAGASLVPPEGYEDALDTVEGVSLLSRR
jgi:(1->4)-alpha-D-glucan 1-alpha-D-glucosylmutase